jgi:hypothetical protein
MNKGCYSTQTYRGAYILLNVDEIEFSLGKVANERIFEVLKISMRTVDRIKKKLSVMRVFDSKEKDWEQKNLTRYGNALDLLYRKKI